MPDSPHTTTLPAPTLSLAERAIGALLAEAEAERLDSFTTRRQIERWIDRLIDLLDQADAAAEDLEPEGDWEPWLAAPEGHACQVPWCRGTDDDREGGI